MKFNKKTFAAIATASSLLMTGVVSADSIGFNVNGGNGAGNVGATVAGPAGAYVQDNWNTFGDGDTPTGSATGLLNDSGLDSGVNVTWTSTNTWNSGGGGTEDGNLMNGYFDNTDAATPTTLTFENIPYDDYAVIVYVGSDGNGRVGKATVTDVNGSTERFYRTASAGFGDRSDYLEGGTALQADAASANFIVYRGLTGSDLTVENVRVSANSGLHGVQIIETADLPEQFTPRLVVNRDTGSITMENLSQFDVTGVVAYTIQSASGSLDQSNWSSLTGQLDDWFTFSADGSSTDLSEGTFGDSSDLPVDTELSLGDGAWRKSPFEDLSVELKLEDGSSTSFVVAYEGNGGNAFEVGDLNLDGIIDANDWPAARDGFGADLTGLTTLEAYGMGDLDGDGDNDIADFGLFKNAFEAANGAGSFAALVPEPTSMSLLALAGLGMLKRRRK